MPSTTKRRAIERDRRRRQVRTLGIAAAVVVTIAIAAAVVTAVGAGDDQPDVRQTRPVTVAGSPLPTFGPEPDPAVGMAAPHLTGETFDGSRVSITPGEGPMAIWFVAHWCPHCQAEVPWIVALADRGGLPEGVDVAAVSTSVDASAPNYPPSAWLQDVGWGFPVLADDEQGTAAAAYGLAGFPFLVLIDGEGNVTARSSGELGDEGIVAALDGLAG